MLFMWNFSVSHKRDSHLSIPLSSKNDFNYDFIFIDFWLAGCFSGNAFIQVYSVCLISSAVNGPFNKFSCLFFYTIFQITNKSI